MAVLVLTYLAPIAIIFTHPPQEIAQAQEVEPPSIYGPFKVLGPTINELKPIESTPEPQNRAVSNLTTQEDVRDYITQVFGSQAKNAIAVAKCESGLNPTRINNNPRTKDYSVGVFQINLFGSLRNGRPAEDKLLDAKFNIDYAYEMYQRQGWGPWSCKRVLK